MISFVVLIHLFISIDSNFVVADFERVVTEGETQEISRGTVYCRGDKVALQVTHPVNQRMIISGRSMTIYYPDHGKAFRIKAKFRFTLPFAQVLITTGSPAEQLSREGFKLSGHESEGGKLFTYWSPPRKLRNSIGTLLVVSEGERVVYTEMCLPDGTPVTRSWFKKHVELDGRYIPVELEIETRTGGRTTREHVTFENVHITDRVPLWVIDLKLPKGIDLKEIKW